MILNLKTPYQLLFLVLVTLGVYYPTLFAPFNSLDDIVVVNQLLNQEGFSFSRHFRPLGLFDFYRPLTTLSFEIDRYFGGLQEPFMHLFNVLLHTGNVVLIWLLARRFGRIIKRESELLPFVSALLFALHPINTEAVNWIAGRTDLLAGMFVFISLYALFAYVESQRHVWVLLAVSSLFLGSLCKETPLFLVPGACLVLLFTVVRDGANRQRLWVLPGLYGLAVATYFALRWGVNQSDRALVHTGKLVTAVAASLAPATGGGEISWRWMDAVSVILKASGFYLVKLLQPLPLNFAINHVSAIYIVPGVIVVAALGVIAWRCRPQEWPFLLSASLATSALAVLFSQLAWTPIAERYMYIPCGPFLIGVVYAVGARIEKPRALKLVSLVVPLLLVAAVYATATRNIVWQDNLTLYQDTVDKSPDFAPAKNQLALALSDHGRREEAYALFMANSHNDGVAAMNRASALWEKGDYGGARQALLDVLPQYPDLEIKILEVLVGITMEQANKTRDEVLKRAYFEDILGWLKRIYARWPNGIIDYRIGRIHLILGNKADAQRAFALAAQKLPADSLYHGSASKLARTLAE